MKELSADPAYAAVRVFAVDHGDKATLRELNVTERSTIVGYRGKTEKARMSFETDPKAIRAVFDRAIAP